MEVPIWRILVPGLLGLCWLSGHVGESKVRNRPLAIENIELQYSVLQHAKSLRKWTKGCHVATDSGRWQPLKSFFPAERSWARFQGRQCNLGVNIFFWRPRSFLCLFVCFHASRRDAWPLFPAGHTLPAEFGPEPTEGSHKATRHADGVCFFDPFLTMRSTPG
jgi:hypothetical protein